jgi:hypothetical protein
MQRPFDAWTISPELWQTLRPMLRAGMVTLECGSGLSTLLFDAAGCRHTALEHDRRFAAPSESVCLAPLVGDPPWYDWEPPHTYELILVDGPPQHAGGRWGIVRKFARMIGPRTVVVIDDTHRGGESELVEAICREYGFRADHRGGARRAFAVLRRSVATVGRICNPSPHVGRICNPSNRPD